MNLTKLLLSTTLLAALGPLAAAQYRGVDLSVRRGGVSIGAELGRVGLRVDLGRHSPWLRRGYVSTRSCAPTRVWIPGSYRTEVRRVWVPARSERRWFAPVYETRYRACGTAYRVLVRAGAWRTVTVPGYYDERPVKVWVPGRYEVRR